MEIFDPLRKKYVKQTPEESVRQSIIKWLASEKNVPVTHMMSEWALNFNGLQYRADIIIFDKELKPLMLVECKAPSVAIGARVIDQCVRYNFVLKVKYIFMTNGKTSYLCKWNKDVDSYQMESAFPDYQTMLL